MSGRKLGVAVVGLGGAVATTAVAGVELLRAGAAGVEGLPLAGVGEADAAGLVAYEDIEFAGWDLNPTSLAKAAHTHGVLEPAQLGAIVERLEALEPWPAAANPAFCRNVQGDHVIPAPTLRGQVAALQSDLERFRTEAGCDGLVVVALASTERQLDPTCPAFTGLDAFEAALDADDPTVSPGLLYAYAAIDAGVPYVNFTPSQSADTPALEELARRRGVPTAGKDGKTGQTLLKTVLAPAFRARALHVEGWFSTNILGNRDGLALDDPASLASKVGTKMSVLDEMLGYPVEDHIVDIRYYRPRGDNKEAWDNIDLVGFLGQRMQVKVDFLCRDSVLAAPLVLELARLADLAARRGASGPQEQLGAFFKAPVTTGGAPEHAFMTQWETLLDWLAA